MGEFQFKSDYTGKLYNSYAMQQIGDITAAYKAIGKEAAQEAAPNIARLSSNARGLMAIGAATGAFINSRNGGTMGDAAVGAGVGALGGAGVGALITYNFAKNNKEMVIKEMDNILNVAKKVAKNTL